MKTCPYCNKTVQIRSAVFCDECGTKLKRTTLGIDTDKITAILKKTLKTITIVTGSLIVAVLLAAAVFFVSLSVRDKGIESGSRINGSRMINYISGADLGQKNSTLSKVFLYRTTVKVLEITESSETSGTVMLQITSPDYEKALYTTLKRISNTPNNSILDYEKNKRKLSRKLAARILFTPKMTSETVEIAIENNDNGWQFTPEEDLLNALSGHVDDVYLNVLDQLY
ncbi:MAG: hypothetical protein E7559_01620 [Ruminococcaceae bacterium]|nr:hypothetical protein [Oscillospiraceae bacterium]